MRRLAILLAGVCLVATARAQGPSAPPAADAAAQARAELDRGETWQRRGFPRAAIDHFQRALDHARQSGDRVLVADAYGAMASGYGDAGQWDRALDFTERQHEADPRSGPASDFRYLFQRGVALGEFQQADRAEASLRQALAAARALGDPRSISMALGELAGVTADRPGSTTGAADLYDQALAIAQSAKLPDLEADWLLNAGAVMRDAGQYEAARSRFTEAMRVERAAGQVRVTPAARKNLAQVLLHDRDRRGAAAMLSTAQQEADDRGLQQLRWEVRVERAVMARDAGDGPTAERLFDEALDILEEAQGSVLVEQLRTGALSRALNAADPYGLYIDFLMARGNAEKAFLVAERGRARAFLDTLHAAGEQIARALPPEYVELEATLLSDISEGQTALRTGSVAPTDRAALREAIRSDEDQLAALKLRLVTDLPAVAAVRYPKIWDANMLAKRLAPDEAILAFFLGRQSSFCWIVTVRGVQTVRLASEDAIDRVVRTYLEAVVHPGGTRERALAAELERTVLPDFTAGFPLRKLIVIPHGILHDLPLDVLLNRSGKRLIEQYELQYAPSASSYALLRGRETGRDAAASVLALGDPVIERQSLMKPLPFTRVELRSIAGLFGSASRILDGSAATEASLRDVDLSRVSVLHFATHGVIDEAQPERSALILTARPPDDDGVLQVREIYGLKLRHALVTLSACETALGANVRGEGVIGLSRAFFYAGADAVVASLWSVNDQSTANLMKAFYDALGRGAPAAAALRQAKLAMIAGPPNMRDPFYWAPFVTLGDGNWSGAPPLSSRWTIVWIAGAAGVAAIALAIIAVRRRRSRTPS